MVQAARCQSRSGIALPSSNSEFRKSRRPKNHELVLTPLPICSLHLASWLPLSDHRLSSIERRPRLIGEYKDIELTRPEIMIINLRDWRQATYQFLFQRNQLLDLKRMRGLKLQNQLEIHAGTPYVAR